MGFFANFFGMKKASSHQKLLRKYASCNDLAKSKTEFEILETSDSLPITPSSVRLNSKSALSSEIYIEVDKKASLENAQKSTRTMERCPFEGSVASNELRSEESMNTPKSPGRCPFSQAGKMADLNEQMASAEGCPFNQPLKNPYELLPRDAKNSEPTILEILGEDIVELMVEKFYHYNLTDRKTRLFFQGVNIERLQRMQTTFLVHLLGGKKMNMSKMRAAHKRLLDLNDFHFDAMMKNLMKAARDLGVSLKLRERLLAAAETTRDDVLGRTPAHELTQHRHH
ncbi:hypothetical protein K7432_005340 [Basidiobolus ranarum]|uniref:Globin-like protein n=1 Tax=Basidiobolus ranarum TaxID=34480 RepID=A0ABR2W3A3_9FUNG